MGNISNGTISVILTGLSFSISLPLLLCIIFRKRFKAHFKPFFLGIISYVAFSFCLVNVVNGLLLMFVDTTKLSPVLIFLYTFFTQAVAALIAQSGKYYAIKILRNDVNPDKYYLRGNALQFGAGYAGMEAIMTVGITMLSYMVYATMFMSGDAQTVMAGLSGDEAAVIEEIYTFLTVSGTTNTLTLLLSSLGMFFFQIGASLLIYRAVFGPNDKEYFRLTLVFNIIMIIPSCIINAGIIKNVWFEALTTLIFGFAVLYYAYDKIKEYEKRYMKDNFNKSKGKKTIHLK